MIEIPRRILIRKAEDNPGVRYYYTSYPIAKSNKEYKYNFPLKLTPSELDEMDGSVVYILGRLNTLGYIKMAIISRWQVTIIKPDAVRWEEIENDILDAVALKPGERKGGVSILHPGKSSE